MTTEKPEFEPEPMGTPIEADDPRLPKFYNGRGDLLPMSLFSDFFVLDNGTTRMVYKGDATIPIGRIVQASGHDLPVVAGAAIAPGCKIQIPFKGFGKIKAEGKLMRGGKVVYDDPVKRAEAKARGEDVWEPPAGWQLQETRPDTIQVYDGAGDEPPAAPPLNPIHG